MFKKKERNISLLTQVLTYIVHEYGGVYVIRKDKSSTTWNW